MKPAVPHLVEQKVYNVPGVGYRLDVVILPKLPKRPNLVVFVVVAIIIIT